MKRILIALVMLATVQAAYAQKSPEAVRKSVDAAKAAAEAAAVAPAAAAAPVVEEKVYGKK